MDITPAHIKNKKTIGKLHGQPVEQITTTGGLVVVAARKNGKLKTLAVGPHPGVSRHIAEQAEPDLIFTDLQKSDTLDPATLATALPHWETISAITRGE